jgi:hypothetical protein
MTDTLMVVLAPSLFLSVLLMMEIGHRYSFGADGCGSRIFVLEFPSSRPLWTCLQPEE